MDFRPPLFIMTGALWLFGAALLGVAELIAMVQGYALPPGTRLIHVHGAVVGGILQICFGAVLAHIGPLLNSEHDQAESHPLFYTTLNTGTIMMSVGFATNNWRIAGVAGLFIFLALLAIMSDWLGQWTPGAISPAIHRFMKAVVVASLLSGTGLGLAKALDLVPQTMTIAARIGHVHLTIFGFLVVTLIMALYTLYPRIVGGPLASPGLAGTTLALTIAGIGVLVSGFWLGQIPVQLSAGVVAMVAAGLFAWTIVGTWLHNGRPRSLASDHVLMATLLFVVAALTGTLVAANTLTDPPTLPFGALHLIAYTHLALIGFVTQALMGAISFLLPVMLSVARTKSHKKRIPYLAALTAHMNRMGTIQLGAMNVGTVGLALVAALVWQFNLTSPQVQTATWVTGSFLLVGLGLFAVKVVTIVTKYPDN
jgi:hypothetical protein